MEQREQMAKLIEAYGATVMTLTNETELCYPYAKAEGEATDDHQHELSKHKAQLIVIMGAAFAELAHVQNVNPAVLGTLDALIPTEDKENRRPLTKGGLLKDLAESISRFQKLLGSVNLDPASLAKHGMLIKEEMLRCRGLLQTLESSAEWNNVKDLANLKLLNTILKAGVKLEQHEQQQEERGKPRPR